MKKLFLLSALVIVLASHTSFAQDCSEPVVTFGEVMAGLQAGFTGGAVNVNTLPSGFFLGASAVDQRGFIDPESGSGWKCESDWGLVSAWLGVTTGGIRSRQEAIEFAENILSASFEVDGVSMGVIETNVKFGTFPIINRNAAIKSWGAFLEPNSLAAGLHTATVFYRVDFDCVISECDGDYETDFGFTTAEFEVLPD